jgi:hypothetical protein
MHYRIAEIAGFGQWAHCSQKKLTLPYAVTILAPTMTVLFIGA